MKGRHTVGSPTNSASGALKWYCLWKPPFFGFSLISPSLPNSTSLSSTALTLLALFLGFLGVRFVFTTFLLPAPLVARAERFSAACSIAASFASSTAHFSFLTFFFGGAASSSESEGEDLISAEAEASRELLGGVDSCLTSLVPLPFVAALASAARSEALKISKRSRISSETGT